jgi:putative ABC transport system permease protein
VPYDGHVWSGDWNVDGRKYEAEFDEASEDFDKVLGIKLLAGRWFERADEQPPWRAVVLNRAAAKAWFQTEDVVGKTVPKEKDQQESRVVGLVDDFRKGGELSAPVSLIIRRLTIGDPNTLPPSEIVVRVAEGSDAATEQAILGRFRSVAPTWSFHLKTLEEMRTSHFRERLAPLMIGAVICGFLLLMVGLGLIGVLWQNVTTRTQEIGIRRATGASGAAVRRQVLLEVFLMTSVSLAVATLLVAQVPFLGIIPFLSTGIYMTGLALSIVLMYVITFLSAYFPSWMATLVEPAGALRSD